MKLSENIYTLRTQRGMSQEDLARRLDVSRQSVSKWETGSAVPDLDKLMNMSQLFGVTLDELVGGEPAAPVQTQAPAAPQSYTQRTCGLLLVIGGLVVLLLLTLLGGPAIGLLLSAPLLVPGVICLLSKKHTGLKCGWSLFIMVGGFLVFATGTSWNTFFAYIRLLAQGYDQVYTNAHILVSLALLVLLIGLLLWTVRSCSREIRPYTKKRLLVFGAGCAVYLLSLLPFQLFFEFPIRVYTLVSQVLVWGRLLLFTVLLTYGWAFFRQWWKSRA